MYTSFSCEYFFETQQISRFFVLEIENFEKKCMSGIFEYVDKIFFVLFIKIEKKCKI